MVCYTIPLAASIIHAISQKKISSWRSNIHHKWLNLLFVGGAIFGIVDHIWNGELFLIGENIVPDILLGFTISIIIFVTWIVIVALDKSSKKIKAKTTQ
jgi:hypothetical protein